MVEHERVNVQLQPEIKDLPHCILFPSMHKTMTLMQDQLRSAVLRIPSKKHLKSGVLVLPPMK